MSQSFRIRGVIGMKSTKIRDAGMAKMDFGVVWYLYSGSQQETLLARSMRKNGFLQLENESYVVIYYRLNEIF
jgi:hypothetical protein